jgi:hypothetical protein
MLRFGASPEPGITLSINAAATVGESSLVATGYYQHPITSNELALFGLNAHGGNYFASVFGGGNAPDEMWYTQPANSRWGDLYSDYPDNLPVTATVSVASATIQDITSNPEIISSQTFSNESGKAGVFNCGVTMDVATSAETSWSRTVTYDVTQTVSYELSFLGAGAGGETSFSFSQQFGEGGTQSNSITLGQSSGLSVELEPGQSVVAELSVSQGTMTIEVVYQITLTGGVFGTFESPYTWPNSPGNGYGSHYIWMVYDVNDVLSSGSAPQVITVTETIAVGFFTNSVVTLTDPTTGNVIRHVRSGALPGLMKDELKALEPV